MTLFLLLMTAYAGQLEVDLSTEHAIGVSGNRGEAQLVRSALVRGVAVKTHGNTACSIGIQPWNLTTELPGYWVNGAQFADCTVALSLDQTDQHLLSLPGDDQVVYALQVCTRDTGDTDRDAIAGIRLWGAKNEMGLARRIDTRHQEIVGDCDKWRKKLECPAGEVVSKLRAHASDNTFTGLGVSCSKVGAPSAPDPQRPRRR